jgi:hypothetical protein
MDGAFPVDTAGVLTGLDEADRPFANALELVDLLAGSDEVRACFARQWLRYGAARNETAADEQALEGALAAFRSSGHDVRELLVALVKSRAFTHRARAAEEVLP